MTPALQAQLISVYKHFAKHPKRVDAQLAFVRQVDKCLTDHGYELWVTEGEDDNEKHELWYCAKCGFVVTDTERKFNRHDDYPCPRCGNPWWNFSRTRPMNLSRAEGPKE